MAAISITDVLTNFGQLSDKFKSELLTEYKANRITGDKYSEVYTALMSQAMQQAVGFVIQKQQGDANEDLIKQKILTEKSQIQDHIQELIEPNGQNGIVQGSIGKQKAVYDAQIKGFKDDAINKGTKLMTDIWSIQRSTDSGISPNPENKLFDGNIGSAVAALFHQLDIEEAVAPNVPYVVIESSAGGATIPATGGSANIRGSMADSKNSVVSITITDSAGNVVTATNPVIHGAAFTASAVSMTSMNPGTLTCQVRIRIAATGAELTVEDTIEKLSPSVI